MHQHFRDTWLETQTTTLCEPLGHHGEVLLSPRCSCVPFPPLSLFMPDVTAQYNHLDPHIEEDRRLVLLADFPEGPNVLEHLKLDDWKKTFP